MILLNGKEVKEHIISSLKITGEEFLTVIVSNTLGEAGKSYVRSKTKLCEKLGIKTETVFIEPTFHTLTSTLEKAKGGIIVQLPFGDVKVEDISRLIPPSRDVDGITALSSGLLHTNSKDHYIIPATAKGIMKMLDYYGISVEGKHVVIIGRSQIVGVPLQHLMLQRDATTTMAHSYTKNLRELCKGADIIVSAVGKAGFITKDFIGDNKPVVIDVGINRVGDTLVGDVDFDDVALLCSAITPVPGGVGQLTTACVVENLLEICSNPY